MKQLAIITLILSSVNLLAEASEFTFQIQTFAVKDGIEELIEINNIKDKDVRKSQLNESLDLLTPNLDLSFNLKSQVSQNLTLNYDGTNYVGEFLIKKYQRNPNGYPCQFSIKYNDRVLAEYQYGYLFSDSDYNIIGFFKSKSKGVLRLISITRIRLVPKN